MLHLALSRERHPKIAFASAPQVTGRIMRLIPRELRNKARLSRVFRNTCSTIHSFSAYLWCLHKEPHLLHGAGRCGVGLCLQRRLTLVWPDVDIHEISANPHILTSDSEAIWAFAHSPDSPSAGAARGSDWELWWASRGQRKPTARPDAWRWRSLAQTACAFGALFRSLTASHF